MGAILVRHLNQTTCTQNPCRMDKRIMGCKAVNGSLLGQINRNMHETLVRQLSGCLTRPVTCQPASSGRRIIDRADHAGMICLACRRDIKRRTAIDRATVNSQRKRNTDGSVECSQLDRDVPLIMVLFSNQIEGPIIAALTACVVVALP